MVMIAQRFPEASFIFLHQANAAHPLRALPEIQMWHDHPRGSTMFRCEWSIIVLERNERLTIDDVRERHVGRVPPVTEGRNKHRFPIQFRMFKQGIQTNAFPLHIEVSPFRDAGNVHHILLHREL